VPYVLKIGFRYLTANPGQSALLIFGVALGVLAHIFMSALIGGLNTMITQNMLGNTSHVTIEAPEEKVRSLLPGGSTVHLLPQEELTEGSILRTADAFEPVIAAVPGVVATSQVIAGSGFLVQGGSTAPVAITGVSAAKVSAITDIASDLIAGSTDITGSNILVGSRVAEDLRLSVGKAVRLRSSTGAERVMTVAGIFDLGIGPGGGSAVWLSLGNARSLLDMSQGVTRIETQIADINTADAVADVIRARTGLKVTPWTESNANIQDALDAQAQTGYIVRTFALVIVVIGVASAMMLSTYRRHPEIGIMRAMGASQRFVVAVFLSQGMLIGLLGGLLGAVLGFLLMLPYPAIDDFTPGTLPIDIRQGSYGLAVLLTTLGAVLASVLPARAASKVDPVQAIGQ
jgi:lipoprotein-releasing system permease protein